MADNLKKGVKKIDWVRKLTSRKFWVAVIGFITSILVASNQAPETIEKITAIVMAGAVLISYILAEGFIDAKSVENSNEDNY